DEASTRRRPRTPERQPEAREQRYERDDDVPDFHNLVTGCSTPDSGSVHGEPREDVGGEEAAAEPERQDGRDRRTANELVPAGAQRSENRYGCACHPEVGAGTEPHRYVLVRAAEDGEAVEVCRVQKREIEQGDSGSSERQPSR